MRNATTFMVGMLMIAMLGALVVPAQSPVYYDEDKWRSAPGDEGRYVEEEILETQGCHPYYDTELLYVDSNGGIITDCGGECPEVPCNGKAPVDIQ